VRKRVDERPVAGFNLVAAIDGEGVCLHYDGAVRPAPLGPGLHVISTDRDADDAAMPELGSVRAALQAPPAETALRGVLARHDGERPICKHGDTFGTVSSTIYIEGPRPRLLHAEGLPCRADFQDFSKLIT